MARPKLDQPRKDRIKLIDAYDKDITEVLYHELVATSLSRDLKIYIDNLDYVNLEIFDKVTIHKVKEFTNLKEYLANKYLKTLTFIISTENKE